MVAKLFDICTLDGCEREHVARGYCDAHYRKFRKYGDPLVHLHRTTCELEGCDRRHAARGLCTKHLKKLQKYGDPLRQEHADHGDPLAFLRKQLGSASDECVRWPFSAYPNGYGSVWYDGKVTGAHRLVCRLAHGEPPSAGLHAAHRCGNRLCINPRHLRWATAVENEADKIIHGTRRAA